MSTSEARAWLRPTGQLPGAGGGGAAGAAGEARPLSRGASRSARRHLGGRLPGPASAPCAVIAEWVIAAAAALAVCCLRGRGVSGDRQRLGNGELDHRGGRLP